MCGTASRRSCSARATFRSAGQRLRASIRRPQAAEYDEQLLKQSPEYRTILATVNARRALEYGFTSIRDVETEGAGYADADVKKAINNGVIPGPRMQVATRALDVTGAYPLQ